MCDRLVGIYSCYSTKRLYRVTPWANYQLLFNYRLRKTRLAKNNQLHYILIGVSAGYSIVATPLLSVSFDDKAVNRGTKPHTRTRLSLNHHWFHILFGISYQPWVIGLVTSRERAVNRGTKPHTRTRLSLNPTIHCTPIATLSLIISS